VKVTADAARRFLVARHLLAPARSLDGGPDAVLEVFRRLGSVQFDPLAVAGRQPYRLQQLRGRRWNWLGSTQFTTRGGFLRRVVTAAPGTRLRIWSPRDRRYSMAVIVR
jgi:hypothetical protein